MPFGPRPEFFIFLMVQFFRGIPRELDEAAMMDGCSAWRIYWKIMLPLSTPVLATASRATASSFLQLAQPEPRILRCNIGTP